MSTQFPPLCKQSCWYLPSHAFNFFFPSCILGRERRGGEGIGYREQKGFHSSSIWAQFNGKRIKNTCMCNVHTSTGRKIKELVLEYKQRGE